MAEFKEVIKQRQRMHEQFTTCDNCPISRNNNGRYLGCDIFIVTHTEEAEEIIMKWAKENPSMTNADKFREVFGVEPYKKGCAGIKCPTDPRVRNCGNCSNNDFWEREYKEPDKE